jgi:hypothetical protein
VDQSQFIHNWNHIIIIIVQSVNYFNLQVLENKSYLLIQIIRTIIIQVHYLVHQQQFYQSVQLIGWILVRTARKIRQIRLVLLVIVSVAIMITVRQQQQQYN